MLKVKTGDETDSSEENIVFQELYDNPDNHEIDLVGGSNEIIDCFEDPAIDFDYNELSADDYTETDFEGIDENSFEGIDENDFEGTDDTDLENEVESTEETFFDNLNQSYEEILHPSLSTTKLEALQMILIYFIRHNLTFAALEDLLLLVNTMLKVNTLPTTKYSFLKSFPNSYSPTYNFYCKNKDCGNLLFSSLDRNVRHSTICNICESENNINSKSEQFFVTLPLQVQLKEIIKQNSEILLESGLKNSTSSLLDITDGEIYRTLLNNKGNTNPKITLVMNTDGVQVFKSNTKSLWPVQIIINELPVEKRFLIKNILVLGLFYDKNHPKMQHFLQPFMMELREINQTGMFLQFRIKLCF